MKRFKLKGEKIGVVFGTFAPMHIGHVDLITRAKRENDGVVVIVSGTETDRGGQINLGVSRRFRYVREVFSGDELVQVVMLDESGIPSYPDGWEPWTARVRELILESTVDGFDPRNVHFYVGEPEYKTELEDRWENHYEGDHVEPVDVTLVERSIVPISATQIRENPFDHWKYITKPFRRHFTKKVLVIGSASGGKTTLVKDLARTYNAPYSLEYAREYQEVYNVRDEELRPHDYIRLLTGQYDQTARIIDEGSHTGLIFADTNSSVTKAYYDYYCKGSTQDEVIDHLYKATFAREKWDLIILVAPNTEYVDDGFRDMTMSDQAIRDEFTQYIIDLMEPFKDKLHIVDGDFYQNYETVKALISEHLEIGI